MSYRFYFYEISKSEIDRIKDMTKKRIVGLYERNKTRKS